MVRRDEKRGRDSFLMFGVQLRSWPRFVQLSRHLAGKLTRFRADPRRMFPLKVWTDRNKGKLNSSRRCVFFMKSQPIEVQLGSASLGNTMFDALLVHRKPSPTVITAENLGKVSFPAPFRCTWFPMSVHFSNASAGNSTIDAFRFHRGEVPPVSLISRTDEKSGARRVSALTLKSRTRSTSAKQCVMIKRSFGFEGTNSRSRRSPKPKQPIVEAEAGASGQ